MTETAPLQVRLRSNVGELAIFIGFLVFLVLVIAETEPVDRSGTSNAPWLAVWIATIWGIRLAYQRRGSGPLAMLAWGSMAAVGTVAFITGLSLFTEAIGPWVRAQAWLPSALVAIAVVSVIVMIVRRVLRESSVEARMFVVGELLGLLLIPFGIWLAMATLNELQMSIGGALALAGPLIAYGLERVRLRRGLEHGAVS